MRRSLPQIPKQAEGLGSATIMDRGLAQKHGSPYVHLAVFAIDVDRVRDARDDVDDSLPFGWEVFLTEAYLLAQVDPTDPAAHGMIEDIVLAIVDSAPGEPVLGTQIVFAVWDAIVRSEWPGDLRSAFAGWKAQPKELVKELAPLWQDAERPRRELAAMCLETVLEPPLAAPTLDALRALCL